MELMPLSRGQRGISQIGLLCETYRTLAPGSGCGIACSHAHFFAGAASPFDLETLVQATPTWRRDVLIRGGIVISGAFLLENRATFSSFPFESPSSAGPPGGILADGTIKLEAWLLANMLPHNTLWGAPLYDGFVLLRREPCSRAPYQAGKERREEARETQAVRGRAV